MITLGITNCNEVKKVNLYIDGTLRFNAVGNYDKQWHLYTLGFKVFIEMFDTLAALETYAAEMDK